jgi:hypothetical protein
MGSKGDAAREIEDFHHLVLVASEPKHRLPTPQYASFATSCLTDDVMISYRRAPAVVAAADFSVRSRL